MPPTILLLARLKKAFVILNMLSCLPHGKVVLEPLKIMSDIINLFDLSPRDQIVAMVTKA